MTFGLPPYEREQFFPNAYVRPEEADIISRSPDFVDRGSVHLLMQRLAQNSKVAHDVRSKINANRAALFFPACVQRKPPPSTQPDPVVEYGWDRTRDKDLVQNMQDQCARLFLECDRLAFMAATPEMAQYCRDQPADWYQRLTSHLTSPTYKIDLKAKMKAGIEPVRDLLSNLFTKLVILHEAAGGDAAGPKPQDVMGELCTRVGIPALSELDLNDEAKEEIRNVSIFQRTSFLTCG
ncbi:uncharacterized protein PHACADRAFT_261982 [Phanerochaete carnosa HHB-10118-sp]|uniref:Uncharacterized protein n=1 Tax=Phanerochaete carnosa (strain HHB-10118-sp) TaxID=650164 RepID=K5VYK2_PHACS|nr:uncharacterized protein PHACADRAFT_261982 [Phanerochaete carnosa HHB-10118-sp]EKM51689.1 hypothetical protein PHACADRAFT_261982 [Phanerochaete carnosa HHB-10118-sp]